MDDTTWMALIARLEDPGRGALVALAAALRAGAPPDPTVLAAGVPCLAEALAAPDAAVQVAALGALRALARADLAPAAAALGPAPASRRRRRISADESNERLAARRGTRLRRWERAPVMEVGFTWTSAGADGSNELTCCLHPGPPRIDARDGQTCVSAPLSAPEAADLLHRLLLALPPRAAAWRSQTHAGDETLRAVIGDDEWELPCGGGYFTDGPLVELAWALDDQVRA